VDYVGTNGTLTFLDGATNASITINILDPNLVESNKTFSLTLSDPTTNSYLVAPFSAVVTITNVYVGLAFGSPTFTVSECAASASIPVVLSGLTNNPINITFGTQNGSGSAGVNYFQTNGTLTFQPGQTVAYFDVSPINNHIIGPDHTVQLNLTNDYPGIYSLPPGVAGVQLLSPSTSLLTIRECNGADIIASGTAFVSGSNSTTGVPANNGVIVSNETVTIMLGLRDISTTNATGLVGTLLLTNGVTSNGIPNFVSSNSYGTLLAQGPTVARPYTFTVVGSNGQTITATLQLRDNENPTGLNPVEFGFTLGGNTISFANTNTIFLPESLTSSPTLATNSVAPGYGYPALINVSGISGLITKATVTFSNFGHSYPSDVDALLEAPNGSNSVLMSHCGGDFGVGNVNGTAYGPMVTFTFDPTSTIPMTTNKLTNGTYLPSAHWSSPYVNMPALPPVPSGEVVPVEPPESPYPYAAPNLSALAGASPNGTWSLWAISDRTGDAGYISNGWILNISTGVAVENDSDIEVTVSTNNQTPTVSNVLVYTVTVTNYGPSSATNIVITDYLPTGVAFLSNNVLSASTNGSGTWTATLPSLAVNAGTSFELYLMPTGVGYITNAVTVLALEPNPNTDNMVTNVNLVSLPSAVLDISLTESPNPTLSGGGVTFTVTVTNGGPSEAMNVVATIILPAGVVPDANVFSPSTGTATNVAGTITWSNIGDLATGLSVGSVQTLTVPATATAAAIGTNLCQAFVSSSVYDPLKGNTFAFLELQVNPLL
jgi:uncharacterized repeat protein (TIGR01451 family)